MDSYNLRTLVASQTKQMLHVTTDDDNDVYTHNEGTKGRRAKDYHDEARMVTLLKQNGLFHNRLETLQNIINKAMRHYDHCYHSRIVAWSRTFW